MKAQVGELKQSPIGLPSLSSLTYDRTPSPFKKSSHKLITNESMRHSATPNDFIDGHQTFYMGLFQKLKMDVDTKKNSSSVLREGSPVKSSSKQLNMSAIEPYRSADINFIDKNIQNLIDKRRTKRFRYLEDDDKIKLAIEPKKLIKGLDELNMKIERTFINRKREDDYSTRHESRRNVDTTQKTYKSQHSTVSVAMKLDSLPNSYQKGGDSRQPMRVKKRSQTNFTRDHRDRDEKAETFQADAPKGLRLADKMKIADEKIEIRFDQKFKKAQPAQLPYVRSISQPRPASRTTEKETKSNNNSAYNTRSFEQSKIKSAQVKEFNAYEESVSGYMYPDKGPVFRKMLDYIKNNDTEILEFDENREYIHLKPTPEKEKEKPKEFRTPSRHESINKGSRKNTELRKTTFDEHGTLSNLNGNTGSIYNGGSINTLNNLSPGNKKLDLMKAFTEHNLPSRPLIKSLENNAFILENYPINAEMCDSIGALLKDKGDVTNISLINNKLNDQALSVLLTPLLSKSAEVSIFRCVKNSFGDFFLGVFEKKFFALGNNTLKELTLDGCKILQKSLIEVIEVLLGARSRLRYLGLSDIGINEHSMVTLNRFIESSEYLISLDVSWNKMNNDAMKMLLDNVRISQSLRSLDLSWNSLGHQDSKLAKILKEMIVTSPLVHLNLSHTGLNDFDAILIIEGVKLNKNLMSLHLGGNFITVPVIKRLSSHLEAVKKLSDFLPPCIDKVKNRVYSKLHPGYQFSYKGSEVTSTTTSPTKKGHGRRDSVVHSSLDDIAEEEEFNQEINNALQLIYYRIIDPDVQENNNVWIESRNCWICERWRKTQVSYTVPKPVENPKNNNNNPGGKRPKNMRNQRLSRDITDEENSSKLQSGKEDVRISGTFSNNQSIKMTFNKQQRAFEYSDYLPPGVHHYKICWLKGQGSMITTGTQETVDGGSEVLLEGNLSIKPRDTDVKPVRENEREEKVEEKKKQEFIKDRSVFAEFRLDDEISLRKAFELDVRRWKLKDATLKKAEADKILIFLYKKYTTVRSIFMRYAAWNCYPFISLEGFADCLDECKVYDNDFKRLDAMKVFNKEAAEDGADGPQTSLSRAEFMEGLLRVAIARVNPKRIADVQAEAVEKFLNDNVFIYALDSRKTYEEFRKLKVHTAEVDALLKLNLDSLESIFKKKRHLFGVRVESAKEILAVAGIQITDRDLLWMFSHSKMLIIDEEKDSKKYLVLSLVEFLEFLVRLADFLAEEGPIAQKLAIFLEKLLKAHKFNFVPSP